MSIVSFVAWRRTLGAAAVQVFTLARLAFAWGCAAMAIALMMVGPGHGRTAVAAATDAAPLQAVDDEQLQTVAHTALSAWLATQRCRFAIESVPSLAAISVPMGRIELRARPLPERQPVSARMPVWIDVLVNGRFVRTQPVALVVHAYRQAGVATEDIESGRAVQTAPFENREIDIATARAWPIDGPLPSARLRTRLLKGESLAAAQLEALPEVARGSHVTLRTRLGEIGIESRGEALQDGRQGQRIWVKVATSTGPVLAHVVGEGLVEMQP